MDEFRYWFAGPLEDIFPDTIPYHFSPITGFVDMAQNEGEGVQLAVRSPQEVTVQVEVVPFAENDAPCLECGLIGLAFASEQSYDIGQKVLRRETPCDFPEYIQNTCEAHLKAGESQSFFITAWTEKTTPAKEYQTKILLHVGDQTHEIPLAVKVRNVCLPNANESDYSYTCWVNMIGMVPEQKGRPIPYERQNEIIYGIKNYSEEFWQLAANFARAMKRQRQDIISVPIHELLIQGMRFAQDGSYLFDFTQFDKYCETFLKHGDFRYLEGYHLFFRDCTFGTAETGNVYFPDPLDGQPATGDEEAADAWGRSAVVCWIYEPDAQGNPKISWRLVRDPETGVHLERMLRPLYAHLKEKGWDKMWLQHVADEMASDHQLSDTRWGYQMIHKCMPGVRTLDAVGGRSVRFFSTELDIHVPALYSYQMAHPEMHEYIDQHEELSLWNYTCMLPHQDFMSRLGDYKLICTRLLHWFNFKTNATGYLHWGWNLWCTGKVSNKPFEDTCTFDGGYATDGWLVFPDVENLDVLETVRTHANRDGLEDRELLRLAAQKDPKAVAMLLDVMLVDSRVYNMDTDTFHRIRTQLLDIAEA